MLLASRYKKHIKGGGYNLLYFLFKYHMEQS